jgi:peptidoglycan/LPS O-acetylase OafA/YrhL
MEPHYSLTHRSDIQGLRAIAILLVVLSHAHVTGFAGGFVGVDVFFVLSGFLITGILFREYRQSGRIVYTAFLARRLKRLFPALIVMLVTVMLVAPIILTGYEFSQQTASAPYATTWSSNFFFTFSEQNYFSELQTRDLFLHTWSLGVEEQFYVLWPALLLILFELSMRKGKSLPAGNWILVGFSVFFLASFATSQYWSVNNPLWSFYLMPSRIWQFALGATVFIWIENKATGYGFLQSRRKEILITGLVLIIASAMMLNRNMTYPGYWATVPSIGATLVILAGSMRQDVGNKGFLSHPALVWIGDRSYSWYLWHWPVLLLGFSWFASGVVVTTGLVAVSLLLAAISYRVVELPFWKGRFSSVSPVPAIATTLLIMLVTVIAIPKALTPIKLQAGPGMASNGNANTSLAARKDQPEIYAMHCDSWIISAKVEPCVLSAPRANKTVVLFGDSIGAQWFSVLPAIYRKPDWRVIVLTKSSCPIVDEDYFYQRIGRINTICRHWRDAAVDYVASIRPDVIYLGSDSTYGFSKQKWINGSKRILDRLSKISGKIFVLAGTTGLPFDGPACLEKNKACRYRMPLHSHLIDVIGYLENISQGYSNVHLLNFNDLVCPGGYCSARNSKGYIVYRDNKHLTDTFVRSLVPTVSQRLNKLGLGPADPNRSGKSN